MADPIAYYGPATASMGAWQGLARIPGGPGSWLRDGDYSLARPCGPPVPELPFQTQGDRVTAIWRQPHIQAIENWAALPAYSTHPDRGDYYVIRETLPQPTGPGLCRWERWYCPVPATRTEYEDYPYAFQYIATPTTFASVTRSLTSHIVYEYFLEQDLAAFPIIQPDALFVLPAVTLNITSNNPGVAVYRTGTNSLQLAGTTAFIVSAAALIVAEKSKISNWNHPIMCRATRYVPGPTLADLGSLYIAAPPPSS